MALHSLLRIEIGVPTPHDLYGFYREIGHFATWGPKEPPPEFAFPTDLDAIGKAREAEGR